MNVDHARGLSAQFDNMNLERTTSTRSKQSFKSVNSVRNGQELADLVLRAAALHDDILHTKDVVARPVPSTSSESSISRVPDGFGLPTGFLSSLKDTVGLSSKDAAKTKYSEKVIKVLESKLRAIAKGEDPRYKDDSFRRTVAIFWGNWSDSSWIKTMKDSRKVEEMILHFVTCSVKTLKKTIADANDYRRIRNEQTYWFMLIFREAVIQTTPSATEVIARVDGYVQNMKAEYEKDKAVSAAPPQLERNNTELYHQGGSMVQIATGLFGTRSDQAAIVASSRIKNDLDVLRSGYAPTCSPRDFRDDESWKMWLQEEIVTITAKKEEYTTLVNKLNERSNSRMAEGRSSSSSRFVAGDMRSHYVQLVRLCMDADLDALANMSDNEMVSLSILSPDHISLLGVCADVWLVPHTTVLVVTSAVLVELYLASEIPLECVLEALANLNRYIQEVDRSRWRRSDVGAKKVDLSDLADIAVQLVASIPPEIKQQLEQYYQADPIEIGNLCALILHLDKISDVDHPAIDSALESVHNSISDFKEAVGRAATRAYREFAQPDNVDSLVNILLSKAHWLEKHCKKLSKQYPDPLLPGLDLTAIAANQQIPLYLSELRHLGRVRLRTATSPLEPEYSVAEDIFALYRQSHRMQAMYDAFVQDPDPLPDINPLFEPFVFEWFRHMHTEVAKWVQSAIELDNFTVSGDDLTSSSVVDIFASLHQFIRVINELGWTDERRKADFMAEAAVLIGTVVRRYGDTLFRIFASEISQVEQSSKPMAVDNDGWLSIASSKLGRKEKAEVTPFNFRPETCVKLNDIAAATVELDKLYFQIDIDKWAGGQSAISATQSQRARKSLYMIKIARADLGEEFYDEEASLRARVELSDEAGHRIAMTRTVPTDTAFPRWEESFDYVSDRKTWLMASVQNETPEGLQHIGRAFFKLDESIFPEMSTRDLWLPLDQQGRILLRISREEEKSDPQYFFGKAFWSLRRIETDMVHICVDKMLPFLRYCVSRKTLKALLRRSQAPSVSTNEALGKIQGFYRSAVSQSESLIPAVKEKSRNVACQALTDVDVESAIGPLLDYFDANLHVLSASLTSANLRSVLSGLWKEILVAIEDVIVPPLSDRPSNMRSLSDGELDIVLKWLKFLRDYFHAGGDESGLPLEELQTQAYQDILRIRIFYDWNTDDLMEECVKDFQKTIKTLYAGRTRGKTMKSQRNLGTIKRDREERKRLKNAGGGGGNGEMILRILRMR
ncbi:hypothetical protein QFC21_005228 [Naganishia friedmannii]|uniref:Uncharacterized protein n=1 Tax=Naganishia friedmannii TaxID=89922 RepID=A0ACC2VC35_9TREE|nr:hypothetical protein QFC21_005228 [Naganishia friedmannii]